jgi:hypothetical protein
VLLLKVEIQSVALKRRENRKVLSTDHELIPAGYKSP